MHIISKDMMGATSEAGTVPKVECDIVIGKVQTIRWPKEHKYTNNVEKPYTERISSMKAH
jgi:hypothetical protein